jgi:hypothetical protein
VPTAAVIAARATIALRRSLQNIELFPSGKNRCEDD